MTDRRRQRRENGFACPPSTVIPDAVPHPRYENTVVTTPWATTSEVILKSFWGYHGKTFFPESAIPAKTERQHCGYAKRPYDVDILNNCVDCRRPFLFFAHE